MTDSELNYMSYIYLYFSFFYYCIKYITVHIKTDFLIISIISIISIIATSIIAKTSIIATTSIIVTMENMLFNEDGTHTITIATMENMLFNEDGTHTITKYNMYIQSKGGHIIDTLNTRCFKIGCNYYGFNGYYSNWWVFYNNFIITMQCGCNEDDTYYENYSYIKHELPIEILFTIKHFQVINGHLNNYNETNIEKSLLFYKNNPNLFPTKK